MTDKLSETKDRLAAKEEIAANDGESAHNALEKANQAQQKAKEAAMKVERAKKELEEIAAILATVQEPGKEQLFDRLKIDVLVLVLGDTLLKFQCIGKIHKIHIGKIHKILE